MTEAVVFWALAPIALAAAVAMVLNRNAVHAALLLVVDFFCLSVFYAMQDAPFLAAVQVIVYAGAIMVLFLFVLMLVGVDRAESLIETIRGQRTMALVAGAAFLALVVVGIGHAVLDLPDIGLGDANAPGNVVAIARLLFTTYVFPFEVTSALLITAAVGAMVLAHKERGPRPTQRELSTARFATGHPTPMPGPGVYAEADDAAEPAVVAE
ncbi:MAG: NADH-quinone oxidoreductase subunit J [Mycobacteriales bacterium]|nr:NADH-quinone oxidoreductase subunit J [Frankia sp.]